MGDYSRDTFRLTNALHAELTGDPVADARHYVGVRLQQGVPLLDADWNELEDIRRFDLEATLLNFFGDGIPTNNNGFAIGPVTADNDFSIGAGLALVGGKLVINRDGQLTYSGQPAGVFTPAPGPLAPPATGTRDDLVYLDVFESEVASTEAPLPDFRLTNPTVGVETARRVERQWVVRVEEGAADLAAVPTQAGHTYLALARLQRVENQPRILATRIFDLRRTDLNVAENLKIPVNVQRGPDLVNSATLAQLFDNLRVALLDRQANHLLFVDGVADHERSVVYFALQHLVQVCSTGALQAMTHSLAEADALAVLRELYDAQHDFVDVLEANGDDSPSGPGSPAAAAFVARYRELLDGAVATVGIQDPLDAADVVGAFAGQQVLTAWLGSAGDSLPEGTVQVDYLDVQPVEDLVGGSTYDITVGVTSQVTTSNQASETFDISIELSSNLWLVDRTADEITLDNNGGSGELVFTVTTNPGNLQCDFTATARARRNVTIESPVNALALEIGQTPTVAAILQYAGPRFNFDGRLELLSAALPLSVLRIDYSLNNRTPADHTYRVSGFLALDTADETGWDPVAGSEEVVSTLVTADSSVDRSITVSGPDVGAGVTGTFTLTLNRIDDVDVPVADRETVAVPFITV